MSKDPPDIGQDLASALIRGGVWDHFAALPRQLQGEFILWVSSAVGADNRARRARTLVALLRSDAGLPGIKDVAKDEAKD